MAMKAETAKVWSGAKIKVWPGAVVLATFPRFAGDRVAAFAGRVGVKEQTAFVAFLTEGDECTLTAPQATFSSWRLRGRASEVVSDLRAVTIEASMPVDLVGFFAPLAARLAAAGIPIVPQCGFRTDHLLVRERQLDETVQVIERLITDASKGVA